MSKKDKLIPELRFGEFQVVWEALRLGSVCKMKSGSFVPAKDINEKPDVNLYPCYGGNGLRGYTKSYTHKGKYSLIGRQGALCGNVNLVEGTFHATEHAVVVKHNERYSTDFLFYTLNNQNLNRYATGQAQPGLSISVIESIRINIPSLPEQQKIASFLSTVDKKINLLASKIEHLEQYKKGVVQKIFNQEIRFKPVPNETSGNENGKSFPEWEKKKLSSFIVEFKEKSFNSELPVLTSSNRGLMLQTDYYEESRITERKNVEYNIIPKDHITYRSRSDNRKFTFNLNDLDSDGLISVYYPVFSIKNGNLNFFVTMFNFYQNRIGRYSVGTSQTVLSINELKKLSFNVPTHQEQTKIANFLSSLDKKIDLHKTQLEKMKTWKKGLLQKMFV